MAPKTPRDSLQVGATINSGWLVFGEMLTESFARPASLPHDDATDDIREAGSRTLWGAGVGRWLIRAFRHGQTAGQTAQRR